MRTALPVLGFLVLILAGCSESVPVVDTPTELAEPQKIEKRNAEFVVCIDNSRSIKPPEQVLIREATMLLADLADQGDRISVIIFGEGARVVVSTEFRSDADRRAFKETVRRQVDFGENFSDIRAGLRLLATERERLFPTADAVHAAILFTDGRLEPKDRRTQVAFQQIQDDLEGRLAGLDLYAVVLGDTYSQRSIDHLGFNGQELMQRHIARSASYFYHAKKLDQLFDVAVVILKKSKGISSLGEEGGDRFRIDGTVRSMTLIVRKRPPKASADTGLPETAEILLEPPDGAGASPGETGRGDESIYRSGDYQHFDLFVVRNPRAGIWKVSLSSGETPVVLSKIVSPVNLRVERRDGYYRNEASTLSAWLADETTGAVARGGYELRARVAPEGGLNASETYVPLQQDDASGQFYLAMPRDLQEVFPNGELPELVAIEIIAQKTEDPWFLRRSDPFAIAFKEPLIHWNRLDTVGLRLPAFAHELMFGGEFDEPQYQAMGFEVPPKLALWVERYDEETGQYEGFYQTTEELVPQEDGRRFRVPLAIKEYGSYRYRYRLTGSTADGLFETGSPWYERRVEPAWTLILAAAGVLLVLIQVIGGLAAKLKGVLQINVGGPVPASTTVTLRPRRAFDSSAVTDGTMGAVRFRLQAKRYLFLLKRVRFTALAGNAVLDRKAVRPGGSRSIKARGIHHLTLTDKKGRVVSVDMTLRV